MKHTAFVALRLPSIVLDLAGTEASKVLRSCGNDILKEFHCDTSEWFSFRTIVRMDSAADPATEAEGDREKWMLGWLIAGYVNGEERTSLPNYESASYRPVSCRSRQWGLGAEQSFRQRHFAQAFGSMLEALAVRRPSSAWLCVLAIHCPHLPSCSIHSPLLPTEVDCLCRLGRVG